MKKYQTNLSELIHKSIMSTKTSCNLAIDIAKGMTALHGASIIHFDLKPANILIDEIQPGEYKPAITDFGIFNFFYLFCFLMFSGIALNEF